MSLKALELLKNGMTGGAGFFDIEISKFRNIYFYEKESIDEAIKELEEYEQKFKDREFKYRTECQNIVSAARLEADEIAKGGYARGGFTDSIKLPKEILQAVKELESQNTFYKLIGYESDGTE